MAGNSDKQAAISSCILGLVRGLCDDDLIELVARQGIPRDDAGLIVIDAKKRVQLAADFNRNEQLGLAIRRLNRILEISLPDGDNQITADAQTALRAQAELNKLLRLHEIPTGNSSEPSEPGTDRGDELELVRAHLGGVLEDLPNDYPASELARVAADRLRAADAGA